MARPVKQPKPLLPEDIVIRSNPIDEFLHRFKKHFPADGVDTAKKKLNGSKTEYKNAESQSYRYHWLTALTSFLGLPNRKLKRGRKQSWKNIGRNFIIGWQGKATPFRNFVNLGLLVPLNIITVPFKLFVNVLKVVLEVLPDTVAICFAGIYLKGQKLYSDQLSRNDYENVISKLTDKEKFKYYILLGSSKALAISALSMSVLFIAIYGIFRCLLSPIDNIRNLWYDKKKSFTTKGILLFLAVSASTIFYAVFFPLLLKKLVLSSAPYLVSHLPAFISNAIVPVLEALGNLLAPIVTVVSKILSLGIANTAAVFAAMPVFVAISALFGGLISTLGVVISEKINALRERWHGTVSSSDKTIYTEMSKKKPRRLEPSAVDDGLKEEMDDELIVEQYGELDAEGGWSPAPIPMDISSHHLKANT